MPNLNKQVGEKWIRGVNLGGWLVLERYIAPYTFSITDCHLIGDFCWYEGALSAPTHNATICDLDQCKPAQMLSVFNTTDYPLDEWHLGQAFVDKGVGANWLNYHFDNFLQYEDLRKVRDAGITHLRVPLPHWILGNVEFGEPFIVGDRWEYFKRMCTWARDLGLEVWPNIHTAPGSQNGFDNSGMERIVFTAGGWDENEKQVQRSLDVINQLTQAFSREGLLDVVTGFGILNEPYVDTHLDLYKRFLEDGLRVARANMGHNVTIFVSDLFMPFKFNDGRWWLNEHRFSNTLLDTHFYQVFDEDRREMQPKEHIDQVCNPPEAGMLSCCYYDQPNNTEPSKGVQRITTEWSAAFDIMPGKLVKVVMSGIANNGVAPLFNRRLHQDRIDFMKHYVEAQMVAYEAKDSQVTHGWFFWTIKTEGGAFAEWDFLGGLDDGWIPKIAAATTPSEDLFGTCADIYNRTNNDKDIVYPGDISFLANPDDDTVGPGLAAAKAHHRGFDAIKLGIACTVVALIIMFGFLWARHGKLQKKEGNTKGTEREPLSQKA